MRTRSCAILTLSALCVLMPFGGVQGQTAEEIRNQIDAHNDEIEKLNAEIEAYEKQLIEIGSKKQTLQGAVNSLDISRKQLNAKISVTKNNISAIELEIQNLSGSISDKETSIHMGNEGLAQAISNLREADEMTLIEQMLGSESISTFWDDFEANQAFQDAVTDHIHVLEETKEELSVDRDASEKKHDELEYQRKNLEAEQNSLSIIRREQQAILDQTKSQESNYQKLLKDKQAAKEAFEQRLTELESKLEYTLDPSRLPSAGKGVLRWPLDKVTITQNFGNTEFAKSGAYSGKGHNGIDFRASIGTPVRAALSGTVEGTGNTDAIRGCYSYGRWILLKHSNGLSTVYGHLSEIKVTPGESVKTGDVIGYSGNTGYATGPHLHFTVYATYSATGEKAVRIMKLGESTGKDTPCANALMPVSPLGAYLNPLDYL